LAFDTLAQDLHKQYINNLIYYPFY